MFNGYPTQNVDVHRVDHLTLVIHYEEYLSDLTTCFRPNDISTTKRQITYFTTVFRPEILKKNCEHRRELFLENPAQQRN